MRKILWLAVRVAFNLTVVSLVLAALIAAWRLLPQQAEEVAGGDVWTCSMHPQVRLPGPGKCPICGMDLVPVSKAKVEEKVPAGLATEEVKPRELFKEVRTVGKVDYNERNVAYITARIAGRIDRLYADFAGIKVKKDDHLADIYSPELVVAQDELIRAVEAARGDNRLGVDFAQATLEAARSKLRLLNLLPEQIREIEKSRRPRTHMTLYAPFGGTVVEKAVREGQYVKEGDLLYRVADLDPLWLYLDVYEYDLAWVRIGQEVEAAVEAFPTETFNGRIVFVDPVLNDTTRSVKVRVNLANPEGKLKPAMYASVTVRVRLRPDGTPGPTGLEGKYVSPMHPEVVRDKPGPCPICGMPLVRVPGGPEPRKGEHTGPDHGSQVVGDKVLAVPVSAVLDTGRRKIAYRRTDCGHYEMVELKLGPRAEGKDESGKMVGYYPVLEGLEAGDKVVVRGVFLLDSERQIEGKPSLLYPEGQTGPDLHSGHALPEKKAPSAAPHKH